MVTRRPAPSQPPTDPPAFSRPRPRPLPARPAPPRPLTAQRSQPSPALTPPPVCLPLAGPSRSRLLRAWAPPSDFQDWVPVCTEAPPAGRTRCSRELAAGRSTPLPRSAQAGLATCRRGARACPPQKAHPACSVRDLLFLAAQHLREPSAWPRSAVSSSDLKSWERMLGKCFLRASGVRSGQDGDPAAEEMAHARPGAVYQSPGGLFRAPLLQLWSFRYVKGHQ